MKKAEPATQKDMADYLADMLGALKAAADGAGFKRLGEILAEAVVEAERLSASDDGPSAR